MERIIIISSTNRPASNTFRVCKIYKDILSSINIESEILDLCELPENVAFAEVHGKRTEGYAKLLEKWVSPNTKFIFVAPEYNGSFPGILKVFLDSVHPKEWMDKFACLVGVSNGRAGNLRGMEHLTGVLNYLKMNVYHNKLPISSIDKLLDENGAFNHPEQVRVCKLQLEGFLKFISSR
ncbi:MAG: NADPH-dependent reductase [Bacteroidetes bacterium]|jgi:NAD(P)H-dependent FMN reductase|nr:NADPH-dependent reductase [Bacteroidota bacterium]